RLEFFSNDQCDDDGYGEGQTLIGSTTVTTDGSGNASFAFTPAGSVPVGKIVTATATDPSNNTSEFSPCKLSAGPGQQPGDLIVSEFRFSGTGGANDEYIELFNSMNVPLVVASTDGSAGFA